MSTSKCQTSKRPVLKATDHNTGTIYLYQPDCHMWSCSHCAHHNKRAWAARIGQGVEQYRNSGVDGWRFVTITMSKKLKTRSQCLYVWPKSWAKLSARMRREYKGIKYVLLPELHKDGRVHVHAIMSHGIKERWLKDNSAETGLGFMAESDPLKRDDVFYAIFYVTKYVGKSLGVHDWPKSYKRIRTSQKWPTFNDSPEFEKLDVDWEYWLTCDEERLQDFAGVCQKSTRMKVRIL